MGSEVWIISRSNNPKDWGIFFHSLQVFNILTLLNKLDILSRYTFSSSSYRKNIEMSTARLFIYLNASDSEK